MEFTFTGYSGEEKEIPYGTLKFGVDVSTSEGDQGDFLAIWPSNVPKQSETIYFSIDFMVDYIERGLGHDDIMGTWNIGNPTISRSGPLEIGIYDLCLVDMSEYVSGYYTHFIGCQEFFVVGSNFGYFHNR